MNTPSVRDAVLRIRDLPTLPTVLGRILATAADPDASALDLGKHIAADQSLSATLLKLVNSAYYGFYRQIASISHAIVMLGFLEVRNLTLTATAFRTLGIGNSEMDRTQLWRHSLGTAMAAERLAKLLKLQIEGTFESGLLHDMGKVALDMLYPDEFREAAHRAQSQGRYITDTETEIFGMDHAEVGGILGEHWNLPPVVVEAIRYHHRPQEASIEPALVQIIALANFLTYQAGLGELSNGLPPVFPKEAAESLGYDEAYGKDILEMLESNQEKIDEFVGALKATA